MPAVIEQAHTLMDLLADIVYVCDADISGITVTSIETDSRQVRPGAVFVALSGEHVDGHNYIKQACDNGCRAVVVEKTYSQPFPVPVVRVRDCREALAHGAHIFYGRPSDHLVLIGITGTNGKTTTSYIVESLIRQDGGNPGVIGTVNYRFCGRQFPAPFTTPEPVLLQKIIRQMVDAGVTHLIMEVSSHALALKRVHGLMFDVALFTNLSRDHLDFHESMEAYFKAKKRLFDENLKDRGTALICCKNTEDGCASSETWGGLLANQLTVPRHKKLFCCGIEKEWDIHARQYHLSLNGIEAEICFPDAVLSVASPLVGIFNLENVIGALAIGWALGIDQKNMVTGCREAIPAPGRLQQIVCPEVARNKADFRVFVDYAHTPDALQQVLRTLRHLTQARIILVFGCGGDRDAGKRFPMGVTAAELADIVVVTSDNSRSESPGQIMEEIARGVRSVHRPVIVGDAKHTQRGYILIEDRAKAIHFALEAATAGDVVLLAGKGHETYQIDTSGKHFFDDRLEAKKQLQHIMSTPLGREQ